MTCPECGAEIYPMVLPHCQTGTFKTPLLDKAEKGAWPCFVISGSGITNPLVAVNQKEMVALRAERDKYKAALEEIRDVEGSTPGGLDVPYVLSNAYDAIQRIANKALEDVGPKTKPPPTPKPAQGMKRSSP